jgi:hypothetical protein
MKNKINKFYYSNFIFTQRNGIINPVINFFFIIKIVLNEVIKIIINFDIFLKKIINKNNVFLQEKNSKRKRCFILGNGPSITKLNLTFLKNEDTLVMNDFFKNHYCKKINPKFYFLLDGLYFQPENLSNLNPKFSKSADLYIKKKAKKINKAAKNSQLVLPYPFAHKYQNRYKYYNDKNIKYVRMLSFNISDYIPKNINIKIGVPFSFNVFTHVLCCAILMGYKEIYLMGAEQDMYLGNKAFTNKLSNLKKQEKTFFNNDIKKQKVNQLIPECTNYISFWSTYEILKAHINLQSFAILRGVKIYNTTKPGILDMYKYTDIKKFIKK